MQIFFFKTHQVWEKNLEILNKPVIAHWKHVMNKGASTLRVPLNRALFKKTNVIDTNLIHEN